MIFLFEGKFFIEEITLRGFRDSVNELEARFLRRAFISLWIFFSFSI